MVTEDRYDSLIQWYAQLYGVDWTLLKAQIRKESNFNPHASNVRSGAVGLAQFIVSTWKQYAGVASRFDPEEQIKAQAHYMADLTHMFHGDVGEALAGYDWGQGNLWRDLKEHPTDWLANSPQETQDYVAKILAYQNEYKTA